MIAYIKIQVTFRYSAETSTLCFFVLLNMQGLGLLHATLYREILATVLIR